MKVVYYEFMTDEELLDFNSQGFIPGPEESEAAFIQRIENIKFAYTEQESIPPAHWEWGRLRVKELFHFEPVSLKAYYSNKRLAPWQGAACWISENRVCQLQLREGFRKGSYLKFYSRGEILAHESVHAARAAFEEPENEEFFAYATAEYRWRRIFGPIFQRIWEPWLLLIGLILGLFWKIGWVFVTILMIGGFGRLIRRHLRLSKAFKNLMRRVKDVKKARAILFRLTDREIQELSRGIWIDGDTTLRWRLIRLYFN